MRRRSRATADHLAARSGDLLRESRDRENLELLEEAIKRFPEHPELRLLYATALLPFRPDEVVGEALAAAKLSPDHPWRLARAAALLDNCGQPEHAARCLEQASALAPGDDVLLARTLQNVSGKIAAARGDDALAEQALRAVADAEPDNEFFAYDLARFLADRGGAAEALARIETVLQHARYPEHLERLRAELSDPGSAGG